MDRLSRMAFGIFAACAALGGAALAADVSLAPGQSLTLGGVQFTPKGALAPGEQPELDALGTYLASHPALSAQITASAPRKGGGKAVKAADRQAKAIRDYVVKKFKLDKRRVLARGQAAAKDASPADEAKIEVAALSATGRPLAPEATLGTTTGQVETKAPWEDALRTPESSEKLYGGQALVTSPGATAELSFVDGARVSLAAEADLSIGGGKARGGKASRDAITLSRGRATADLTAADRKAVLWVSTPAAELTLAGRGRGIVSVDSLNRTQVAVLAGSAIVSGKGKAVVKAGFVVDVAKGIKPSKPRPLAGQPKLLKPFDEARVQGEVALSWRSAAPRNRLEVSSGADFASKAHEAVVEGNAATVKLPEGTYFWRVTALDETGLESPPSDVKSFKVGAATAVAAAGDEAKPAEEAPLGLGLDLSSGDAAPKAEEEAPPPLPITVNPPAVDDPDLRQPAAKPKGPEEPLASKFHLGVALTPAAVFGLPSPYLAGDFELRASFAVMPFLHVLLAGGAGERTFLGAPLPEGPRYIVLGTWHAGLGLQAPFGEARQGPFAELVAGIRSFTAAGSDLGYLTEVGRFEVLAGGGYRLRVADHRLDVGLRAGYTPGARSAFGLQLLIGGWIF